MYPTAHLSLLDVAVLAGEVTCCSFKLAVCSKNMGTMLPLGGLRNELLGHSRTDCSARGHGYPGGTLPRLFVMVVPASRGQPLHIVWGGCGEPWTFR